MQKVVIGLSGGMDSATLLGILLGQGLEVHCCSFYYGSKHNKYENRASEDLIDFYSFKNFPVVSHPIDVSSIFKEFSSNLLLSGEEIPEGNYTDESMKLTVVPGRNLIFASIMAGLAESIGAKKIALGVHSGDHAIYPDCRPAFIEMLNRTILLSSEEKVSLITPFLRDTKAGILYKGLYGVSPKVPYELTRTCYKDQEYACGKCGSCRERLEAFAIHGMKDPIKYEE